jgi:hypothetical protein
LVRASSRPRPPSHVKFSVLALGRRHLPRLLGAALLTLVAAGCVHPVPNDLVEVGLSVVGGPVDADGALGVVAVRVEVFDQHGDTVRFNGSLEADAEGSVTELTLEPGAAPVTMFLPRGGTYTFAASGYGAGGEFLAFGEASRVALKGRDDAVAITMAGLLGHARLDPRTPVHALLPGQTLDLLLTVMPPAREDLVVPPADYEASYEVENATTIASSGLGVRLQAGPRSGGDVVAKVEAEGLVILGSRAHPGVVTAELRLPFATDVAVDMTPPEVSALAFDPAQKALTGVADDDLGVVRLDVYDGPVLLASSDEETADAEGVPVVSFPGGGTGFVALLDLPPGTHEVTVYASDFSRNQGTASLVLTVP